MSGIKNLSLKKGSGQAGSQNLFIKFVIGFLAIFILLAILNLASSQVRNIFFAFSSPIQKTFWTAGHSASAFISSFFSGGAYAKENFELKKENQQLLGQIYFMQSVINANGALSAVSETVKDDEFKLSMAQVMGLNAASESLTISKGSAHGISEGMPVIDQNKSLVGKVFKTYANYSEVVLISSKSSIVSAEILRSGSAGQEGQKEIKGVIKGTGDLRAVFDLVPIDEELINEDIIITSPLDASFPSGLLVGKVSKIEKNDQNPHQRADVQLFFNISSDNLFVITNYKH